MAAYSLSRWLRKNNWTRWLRPNSRPRGSTFRRADELRRRPGVESLEERTLPAVLPSALVSNPATIQVPGNGGYNQLTGFSPDVAVDPLHATWLVEVHTNGSKLFASYSEDGGQTWTGLINLAGNNTQNNLNDPTTNAPYAVLTNPTVAIDRAQNIYITDVEHNALLTTAGALVGQRWFFTNGGGVSQAVAPSIIYQWVGAAGPGDPIENPVVAVDNNVASFTDTTAPGNRVQIDTMANIIGDPTGSNPLGISKSVAVVWNTSNVAPSAPPANFEPNVIMAAGTGDGGTTWTSPQIVNDGGDSVPAPTGGVLPGYADPQVVFTQGSADGRVRGGQMVVGWNDFNNNTFLLDSSQPDQGVAGNPALAAYNFNSTDTGQFLDAGLLAFSTGVSAGGNNYATGDFLTTDGSGTLYPAAPPTESFGGNPFATQPGNPPFFIGITNPTTATGPLTQALTDTPGFYITQPTNPNPVVDLTGIGTGATVSLGFTTVPATRSYTTQVSLPNNFTVNDVQLTLDLTDANINELTIELDPPGVSQGNGIVLVQQGDVVGPNGFGELNGNLVGTVFDDNATQAITDPLYSSPYIGTFTGHPGAAGMLDIPGVTTGVGASDNGTWTLQITDNVNDNSNPTMSVDAWSLKFSHISTTGFGTDQSAPIPLGQVNPYTPVTGAPIAPYPQGVNQGPFGPEGVGPGLSLAVDNTLGAFSQYEGRVYLAYTGVGTQQTAFNGTRYGGAGGSDTNVYLFSADNIAPSTAPTWNGPTQVNDDSVTDGFSEGNRPQFMPTVAVDQTTGTVGVMYYDGRWDPSGYTGQSRAANSFSDSINGGQDWSTSTFFNASKTATDAITEKVVTMEPVPDNVNVAPTTSGFGDRQGLAMADGHVYPVFAGNDNIAGSFIKTAGVTIAAGPRVIDGDMGPIVSDFTPPVGTATYNNVFAADGTREFTGFAVEFDRPVVIGSFTTGQVTVKYHDTTTPAALPDVNITGFTITPLDAGGPFGLLTNANANLLATTFLIQLVTPRSAVGTYSYAIGNLTGGPIITDGLKTYVAPAVGIPNHMDQNQNADTGEVPDSYVSSVAVDPKNQGAGYVVGDVLTASGGASTQVARFLVTGVNGTGAITGLSIIQVGRYTFQPVNPVTVTGGTGGGAKVDLTWTGSPGDVFSVPAPLSSGPFQLPYSQDTLPLIIPGPHPSLAANLDNGTSVSFNPQWNSTSTDNTVLNGTNNGIDVTFDRNINASTFTTANVLRIEGPLGPITTYSLGPTVTFTGGGGTGAVGFATIVGGVVTGVAITNQGSGYATTPIVVFNGGGGSGATGTATVVGGKITGVTVTSGGLGYTGVTVGSTALNIPDNGTLNIPVTVNDSLQINNLGVGLSLSNTQVSDITAELIAPDLTVIPLFDGGSGTSYTGTTFDDYAPDSIVGGSAPYTGIFRPAPGVVGAALVTGGNGYKVNDILTLQGGSFGTAAQLQVTTVKNGAVTGIKVLRPGSYTTQPTNPVSVTDVTTPAATGATFALTFGGSLSSLNGKNYLGTWTLRIIDNTVDGSSGSVSAVSLNPISVTPNPQTLSTATVQAAGTGYKPGDHLVVQGGAFAAPAVLLVTSVTPTGAVKTVAPIGIVQPVDAGLYSTAPPNPASVSGGSGSGATFNLTFASDGTTARTFRVTFPTQTLSGTYTVTLGRDTAGNYIKDASLNSATVAVGGTGYHLGDTLSLVGGTGTAGLFQVETVGAIAGAIVAGNINNAGSGYKIGDTLTVRGGTFTAPAIIQVANVNGTGGITAANVLTGGTYSALPTNPVPVSGGSGTGATFTLTFTVVTQVELVSPGSYTVNPPSPANVTDSTTPAASGAMLTLNFGNRVDTQYQAGVPLLVGTVQTGGALTTNAYPSGNINTPLPAGTTIDSPVTVPDSYLVQGVTVTLNILHPNDPDLVATLIAPDGTRSLLFSGVGRSGSSPHANFTNTTLDDSATVPIQLANTSPGIGIGAGPFDPQLPLTTAFQGHGSLGAWILEIHSNSSNLSGTLVNWTLTLKAAVNGLGEAVADQFTAPFRIFTQAPTDAVSQQSWTAVGPASINNGGGSGRIGGLALDPSDPSGNTVYTAGASGSVWKTTDFMTTNPNGPTWIPLTDVGPANSLNTGSIAVFGRNNDPNQSIVFVATGEGSTGTPGVGLLRSMDGGRTWALLDSSDNVDVNGNILPINDAGRDHVFAGTTSFRVIVDPKASPAGYVIVYVANSSGVWRSNDSGGHWSQVLAGDATDVALSAGSAGSTGNLQILYAALVSGGAGAGVYFTSNATAATAMVRLGGGKQNPIRRDVDVKPDVAINISNDGVDPGTNAGNGRITLATPALTGNPLENTLYEGWCYAVISTAGGAFGGLYVTKDFGQNWTLVRLPVLDPFKPTETSTNDDSVAADDSVTGGAKFPQAKYNVSLAVDPNNANVVYIGGTADANPDLNTLYGGFIRVDTSAIVDPYAVYAYDNSNNDGGLVQYSTTGAVTLKAGGRSQATGMLLGAGQPYGMINPNDPSTLVTPLSPYYNMLRDPESPFLTPASLQFTNIAAFGNSGENAHYNSFTGGGATAGGDPESGGNSGPGLGGTDQHHLLAFVDPLTGRTRLIFGDDQGIWTGTDDGTGNAVGDVGSAPSIGGTRNGNLQITQFYDGATQPSTLAADIAQAEFYGVAQDDGFPVSTPDILDTGYLNWNGPGGDGSGVKVDQTGSGTAFYYKWPCCGGSNPLPTDFWSVVYPVNNEVSRTTGLIQNGDDPGNNVGQWPFLGGSKFAVNPIDGTSIVMSSQAGRIFLTSGPSLGQGVQWFPIGDPTDLDSTYAPALAFGAPVNAGANLSDFIYAGTISGNIFVTFTGGGVGTPWMNISGGLDRSAVQFIVTNPNRGSHEAYAVTQRGVYWMADSSAYNAGNPATYWQNITGNLFQLTHQLFNDPAQVLDPTVKGQTLQTVSELTALQADWRYAIPDANGTHPVLYVGGVGGVFRSLDKGATWTWFPNTSTDGSVTEGGQFPAASSLGVSDLALSLGNINQLNGTPDQSYGRNMLVATTYGRGTFAIRLNDQIIVPSTGAPLYTYAVNPVEGPHVTAISGLPVGGNGANALNLAGIQVTFSGPIDPATFDVGDVLSVTDPSGNPVVIKSIQDITGGNPHNVYEIVLATPSTAYGFYKVSLGTSISDYSGYKLDQDQDLFVDYVTAAGIVVGGTGYKAGDHLTVQGGTGTAAVLLVNSVNAKGAVTSVSVLQPGSYTVEPSIPATVTDTTTPAATGAQFNLTFGSDANGSPDDGFTGQFLYQPFLNHAPTLSPTSDVFPSVFEDQTAAQITGTSVFAFINGLIPPGIADADSATYAPVLPPVGIAVTSVDNTNGLWQYSLDNGVTWNNFGTGGGIVSFPKNAVLLAGNWGGVAPGIASNDVIRFVPNPNWNGTSAFQYKAWDLTTGLTPPYGTDGGIADTTLNGGATAFSSATGTATITVGLINDQPNFTANAIPAVAEDIVPGSPQPETVNNWVTSFNPGGAPDANENSQTAFQYVISVLSNPALFAVTPAVNPGTGQLTYTINPGINGTSQISVQVRDSGGQQVVAATVAAGGSGYKPGDILTIQGGTFFAGGQAQLVVTSVTAGAVTGVTVVPDGAYNVLPTNPVSVSDVTTPAASGATFNLTFGGVDTSVAKTFTIKVNAPVITISPSTLPNATAGVLYSAPSGLALSGVGGFPTYSNFQITAGALPAGMNLSSGGVISGTPTDVGTFNFTVQVQDSSTGPNQPYTGSQNFTLVVNPPVIVLTAPPLPGATAGVAYNQTIAATGGTAAYSNFIVTSGSLPTGLTLQTVAGQGVISGFPTDVDSFTFTIQAQDSTTGPAAPYTGSQQYTINVAAPTITFTPSTLPDAIAGQAYTQVLSGSGGTAPYKNFTVTSGSLPPGVSLSNTTGAFSGAPNTVGSYSFTVTMQDSTTGQGAPFGATQNYTLVVDPPVIGLNPSGLPAGKVGVLYSQTLTGKNGTAPFSNFVISIGSLPTGLALNPNSGLLSGTPGIVGTFNFTVSVQDSTQGPGKPYSGSQAYSLTINPPTITITPNSLPSDLEGTPYPTVLKGQGGTAPYSFSVLTGSLPAGLTLNSDGTFGGAPTAAGSFSFTVQVQDSTQGPAQPYGTTQPYILTVIAPFKPTSLANAQAGVAYSAGFAAAAGTGPATNFTISAGALPNGLTLSSLGILTGTPSQVGNFSFTVTANDKNLSDNVTGPASQAYTLTVTAPSLSIAPSVLNNGQAGVAYNQTLAGQGGTAPYSFAVTGGGLPNGLTLSTGGTLSGTPTAVGTFTFTVTATDSTTGPLPSSTYSVTQSYTVAIAPPSITFTPATLPADLEGAPYSQTLNGQGGTSPYSNFAITSGSLPTGMSLSGTGTLSGTPTVAGAFNFVVRAQDSTSGTGSPFTASQGFSLTVLAPFSPASLPGGQAGVAYVGATFTAVSGTGPVSNFSIAAGALPGGLNLSSAGVLSGTPTAVGLFTFTVSANDINPGTGLPTTASQVYTLLVSPPVITLSPASLTATATAGNFYSQALTASGGTAPYSNFTVTAGSLPTGLTLSLGGTLSGTPSAVGSFNFTVTAQDSTTGPGAPYTGSRAYSLTVNPPVIGFSPATLPAATAGALYTQTLTANGGTAPLTHFILKSGSLPTGLTLDPNSGKISGTPTVVGSSFRFTVQAQDSSTGPGAPYTGTHDYTLVVNPPVITLSPSSLPAATAGALYSQTLTPGGGTAPYSNFVVTSGALPAGLSLSSSNGKLTGTPTATGTFNFTVSVRDSTAGPNLPYSGSQSFTLTVAAPNISIAPSSLPGATAGAAYSQALTAGGGTTPYSHFQLTATSAALPGGLTLSAAGLLSGTPTAVGTFTFTVQVQDSTTGPAAPYTGTQTYTLAVAAPTITFTPTSLPLELEGGAFSQVLTGHGGTAPYSNFAVISGGLPDGVTLSSSGTLGGAPQVTGTFSFTVQAQDSTTGPAAPYTGTQDYVLVVNAPFTPATLPDGQAGVPYPFQTFLPISNTGPASSFRVSAGALPDGMRLTAGGQIGGTPTAVGTFNFTVSAQDTSPGTGAVTVSQPYSITVAAPVISIAPATLPDATFEGSYTQVLTGQNGTAPYSNFTITSGTLPDGLTLSPSGTVSGTPTVVGTFPFTVQAQDSTTGPDAPYTGSQQVTLTVDPDISAVTVTSSLASPVTGQAETFTATVKSKGPSTLTPQGTVDFLVDGNPVLSGAALVGGKATYTATLPAAGSPHAIVVNFHDSDGFFKDGSGSLPGGQTVGRAKTTTTVTSSANPDTYLTPVTITAAVAPVAPGGGVPDGSVTFVVDSVSQGGFGLDASGHATITLPSLGVGKHTVTANYSGSPSYLISSNSLTGGEVVNKAPSSTDLNDDFNPSRPNEPTTFTATVSSAIGTPTGTVTFSVDGTAKATVNLTGGQATYSTATLTVASHSVVATYNGSATLLTSSKTLTQVVKRAGTTQSSVALSSSDTPAVVTDPITFTAQVSGSAATPTGGLSFVVDGVVVSTVALDTSGQAQIVLSNLGVSTTGHTIKAVYYGDDTYAASSSSINQVVNKAATQTVLSDDFNASQLNEPVNFTATVTSDIGTPTGTVTFSIDGAMTTVNLTGGVAHLSTSTLTVGNHNIVATYNGSGTMLTSSGKLTQVVKKAGTTADTLTVGSSEAPSVIGDTISFTATVSGGAQTPSGAVTFLIDGATTGTTVALDDGGQAQLQLSSLAVGQHTIKVVYYGDDTYAPNSKSITQVVNKAPVVVGMSSSASPVSIAGTPVTFLASVGSGTSNIPGGSVTFLVDGKAVATVALSNGQAAYATTALAVGSRRVTANYGGSAVYATGTVTLIQMVQQPGTTADSVTVVSDANPSAPGQPVTFQVSVVDPSHAGTPTGWVRFVVDSVMRPFQLLDANGQATMNTSALAAGNHRISAVYSGDLTYAAGTAPAILQTVSGSVQGPASLAASITGTGSTFTLTVTALTATGTVATNDNEPVSFTVVSAPAAGTVDGNKVTTFTNGVALFPGLSLSVTGSYEIEIISDNLVLFFNLSGNGRLS
jgi:subtilisin-like proprotein convertase family protein